MRRAVTFLGAIGTLAGALVALGIPAGCGGSKSGMKSGAGGSNTSGGSRQGDAAIGGTGGVAATGGTVVSSTGGSGGRGGEGGAGTGGSGTAGGTGGMVKGGNGGTITGSGGLARGGAGGSLAGGAGGATTTAGAGGLLLGGAGGSIVGSGGKLKGGADGGGGGVGGMLKDGAAGAGGAPPLDGGSMPPKCTELATREACDARDDCHPVFEDPGTCGCASPGCCARFKSCAAGEYASCTGQAMCEVVAPFCDPPYVVAYSGMCYEGCAFQDDCLALPCPRSAPAAGSACSPADHTCYYEDCAGAGRKLVTCIDRVWQVESAACGSFRCEAPNTEGGGLTCTAGQICVVTRDTSFRVTPTCVEHTCGTRALATSCIGGLAGQCSPKYQLGGVVVSCTMPVP